MRAASRPRTATKQATRETLKITGKSSTRRTWDPCLARPSMALYPRSLPPSEELRYHSAYTTSPVLLFNKPCCGSWLRKHSCPLLSALATSHCVALDTTTITCYHDGLFSFLMAAAVTRNLLLLCSLDLDDSSPERGSAFPASKRIYYGVRSTVSEPRCSLSRPSQSLLLIAGSTALH